MYRLWPVLSLESRSSAVSLRCNPAKEIEPCAARAAEMPARMRSGRWDRSLLEEGYDEVEEAGAAEGKGDDLRLDLDLSVEDRDLPLSGAQGVDLEPSVVLTEARLVVRGWRSDPGVGFRFMESSREGYRIVLAGGRKIAFVSLSPSGINRVSPLHRVGMLEERRTHARSLERPSRGAPGTALSVSFAFAATPVAPTFGERRSLPRRGRHPFLLSPRLLAALEGGRPRVP
jgi:hypothetical protein